MVLNQTSNLPLTPTQTRQCGSHLFLLLRSPLPRPPPSESAWGRGTAEIKSEKSLDYRQQTSAAKDLLRGVKNRSEARCPQSPGLGRLGALSLRLRCLADSGRARRCLAESVGLSHGAARGLGRIRRQASISFPSGSAARLARLDSGHLQPRQSREQNGLRRIYTPVDAAAATAAAVFCCKEAAPPFFAAQQGRWGDQEKMLRVCALQKKKKNHLLSSGRAAERLPSPCPLLPSFWQLLPPLFPGNSRTGSLIGSSPKLLRTCCP